MTEVVLGVFVLVAAVVVLGQFLRDDLSAERVCPRCDGEEQIFEGGDLLWCSDCEEGGDDD